MNHIQSPALHESTLRLRRIERRSENKQLQQLKVGLQLATKVAVLPDKRHTGLAS
jgi:hypothetical protein